MLFRVLVEGPDDLHLVKNLAREHGIDLVERQSINECGGVSRLLEEVLPLTLRGSYGALAIIVDADENVASRWQSVQDRLTAEGYDVPTTPQSGGIIVVRDRPPVVGVWVMPDNTLPGALEAFAERLIPQNDEVWPMAQAAVARIPVASRRFTSAHTRKAEIHTYLAWQEEPGTPLGLAVTKRYFDSHTSAATEFIAWLRQLLHGS